MPQPSHTQRATNGKDPASLLLLNTLALEESIAGEDWNAAAALLEERDSLLLRLEREIDESCLQMIDVVQQAEARLMQALRSRMSGVIEDLVEGTKARRASKAYAPSLGSNAIGDW